MNSIVAQRWLSEALQKRISLAKDRVNKVGEDVLIYSETKKEWLGPFRTVQVDDRMVTVELQDGFYKSYNDFHVKPFYKDVSQNFHIFKFNNDLGIYSFDIYVKKS